MFLSDDSHEDTNGASSSSSFVLFPSLVDLIQVCGVDHILFLVSNIFSCRCTSFVIPFLAIHWFRSAKDIWRLVLSFKIHSTYFDVVISFKPFNSTGAISFSRKHSKRCIFWVGPNPHVFPRILPDSSIFPGAILNSFEVWRKYELSSVKCLSPRSFKIFSSLVQLFHSSLFRSISIILGVVSHRHSLHLDTEEDFPS